MTWLNRPFPNSIFFQFFSISLAFNKIFYEFGYLSTKELRLQQVESIFSLILRIYEHECHG